MHSSFRYFFARVLHDPFVIQLEQDRTDGARTVAAQRKMSKITAHRLNSPFSRSIGLALCRAPCDRETASSRRTLRRSRHRPFHPIGGDEVGCNAPSALLRMGGDAFRMQWMRQRYQGDGITLPIAAYCPSSAPKA